MNNTITIDAATLNNTVTISPATTLNNTVTINPATATSTVDWATPIQNTYTTTRGRWDSIDDPFNTFVENIRAADPFNTFAENIRAEVCDRFIGGRGNGRSRIVADKGYFKEEREECFELPDVEELFK